MPEHTKTVAKHFRVYFQSDKDSLLYNYITTTKIRKLTLIQYYYLIIILFRACPDNNLHSKRNSGITYCIQCHIFSASLHLESVLPSVSRSVMSDSLRPHPWTVVCQAPLSMGLSRQDYWSGLPFP